MRPNSGLCLAVVFASACEGASAQPPDQGPDDASVGVSVDARAADLSPQRPDASADSRVLVMDTVVEAPSAPDGAPPDAGRPDTMTADGSMPSSRACPSGLAFTFEEGATNAVVVLSEARVEHGDAWCGRAALVWTHGRGAAASFLSLRLPFARVEELRGKTFFVHVRLSSIAPNMTTAVQIGSTRVPLQGRPGTTWAPLTAPIPADLAPGDANTVYVRVFVDANWEGRVFLDDLGWR